jgi:hypothetical protein
MSDGWRDPGSDPAEAWDRALPNEKQIADAVNHPAHYRSHPSGVECIQITEHMDFLLGNCVKYIWRAGLKSDDAVEDVRKAVWYLNRWLETHGH